MVLDQAEVEGAPVGFGRIPRGWQESADPAAARRALPFRFVLEARHMPVDPMAQVGKSLAQGRLDLEPLFLRRDHARGQLQPQADLDARLALRLRGDDLKPDQLRTKPLEMVFKLPALFCNHLRRALLAMFVQIAQCGLYLHFRHFL